MVTVIGQPIQLKSPTIRDLTWGDINFLHTTDTHGWYSGHKNQAIYSADWGDFVSFGHHMKQLAASQNQDLLLIDSGDRHDGNGLSDVTTPNGQLSMPIFTKQHYDLLTIGNHELYEWENSLMEYEEVSAKFGSNYVSSNVEIEIDSKFVPIGNKYKYFTTPVKEIKILSFGFIFDFTRNNNKTRVTPIKEVIKETWFNDVLKEHEGKTDLIAIVTHVPISHYWPELFELHSHIREFYPNTTIQYFGGHSHIRDFVVFDENATGLQSGRFSETLGWTSIRLNETKHKFSRNYIDFNLNSFKHHSKRTDDFETEEGKSLSQHIDQVRAELDLDTPLGVVNTNYYLDYVPLDNKKSIFHLLTSRILPSLEYLADAKDERIIIINTGSVRYDLYKGPYTVDTQYIISPFENNWTKITLPKSVAKKVATVLNKHTYIKSTSENYIDHAELLPPHHYYHDNRENRGKRQRVFELSNDDHFSVGKKLTKGYVTFDDFGHDGDDTLHKPVIQFPLTNVVESVQLQNNKETDVDLVFYQFILPNILSALDELKYDGALDSEFYSSHYLGRLINEFIRDNEI